jgi:hypothetical protein
LDSVFKILQERPISPTLSVAPSAVTKYAEIHRSRGRYTALPTPAEEELDAQWFLNKHRFSALSSKDIATSSLREGRSCIPLFARD